MRRELILKSIETTPGISYNEIKRDTNLSNGVVSHYIYHLINEGVIEKFGSGRSKYFSYQVPKNDRIIISLLHNQTNQKIIKILLTSNLYVTSEYISKRINKSHSTISVSLKILQKHNLIEREIMNKKSKITSDIAYKISKKAYLRNFLKKYKI
tara:strand:- start:16065 stop:16526 length:462 start_codon:yes stop_codon:yes gene_type:complete